MHRVLKYILFFAAMVVLQAFLFGRIGVSVYLNPLVYVAFIVLLPMEFSGVLLLLTAFAMGAAVDLLTGVPGLNTIATVCAAFCRPLLLFLFAGKDEVKDGGVPGAARLGRAKFMYYMCSMVLIHSVIFFSFEALTWEYYYVVAIRILISSVITVILVYFIQKLFFR